MKKNILAIVILLFVFVCVNGGAIFAETVGQDSALVVKVSGEATCLKKGSAQWEPLKEGVILSEGDSVKTGDNTEVLMRTNGLEKTAEVTVRKNSEFVFKTFRHDTNSKVDTTLLDVRLGAILVQAEKLKGESKFEVKTPTSIVGIRGTTFEVRVSD